MRTRIVQKINLVAFAAIAAFTVPASAWSQGNNWNNKTPHLTTHGNPPSVTSFGFGGQPGFHGVPASVTSPNFNGTPFHFQQPLHQRPIFAPHRHHDRFGSYGSVIAVPYAYPVYLTDGGVDDSAETNGEDYRGGPTVFDRRGPGSDESAAPQGNQQVAEEDYRMTAPSAPATAEVATQPHTVLVFKDGRQLEVMNYAIVGVTLFDLTGGLTRKVPLAELDLPATVRQNDDRGVEFQLPAATRAN